MTTLTIAPDNIQSAIDTLEKARHQVLNDLKLATKDTTRRENVVLQISQSLAHLMIYQAKQINPEK